MRAGQAEILDRKKEEQTIIVEMIDGIGLDDEWTDIFTMLCLERGFRNIDDTHLVQMRNIADVDSDAVKYLSTQDKKAGLETLEDLSLKIEDEMSRAKAVSVILSKGIKQGRKEIDLIISMANSTPNLFDHMEETL